MKWCHQHWKHEMYHLGPYWPNSLIHPELVKTQRAKRQNIGCIKHQSRWGCSVCRKKRGSSLPSVSLCQKAQLLGPSRTGFGSQLSHFWLHDLINLSNTSESPCWWEQCNHPQVTRAAVISLECLGEYHSTGKKEKHLNIIFHFCPTELSTHDPIFSRSTDSIS